MRSARARQRGRELLVVAREHELELARDLARELREGIDQPRQVLVGIGRADVEEERGGDPVPLEHGAIGLDRLRRSSAASCVTATFSGSTRSAERSASRVAPETAISLRARRTFSSSSR